MLVPIKWLKDFVDVDLAPEELADKLVSCGFEVEDIINAAGDIQGVYTAKILSVEKHPAADRLIVCKIAADKEYTVVTNNVWLKPGDIVPFAADGAVLHGGKKIHAGEVRGVRSDGMFTGGKDLNVTESDIRGAGEDKVLVLPDDTPVGIDFVKAMELDDVVLDIGITANRTDANGILGIAREVAAITGKPLKMPEDYIDIPTGNAINGKLEIVNEAPDLCPRYMAAMLTDVVIEESPTYIKRRLRAAGLRPINNIVDITNYVLLEVGQPMHAFDLKTIKGGRIVVRRAREDEKIVALDGKTYTLNPENLAICNAEEPMAIAGVMGGAGYSIFDDTAEVVFESARFKRDSVRRTSRSLGLSSDSSQRFSKGIDYYSQEAGLRKAVGMVVRHGWGKPVKGVIDSYPVPAPQRRVSYTAEDIENILGISVPEKFIVDVLNSLMIPTVRKGKRITSSVPAFREDIVGVNDIAEEVIRMYGYDSFDSSSVMQGALIAGEVTKAQEFTASVKNFMVGAGAYETLTYSFITPKAFDMLEMPADDPLRKAVVLTNPLGEDYSVMRTSMAHSMLKAVATNAIRLNKEARLFEIAKVFRPEKLPLTDKLPEEKQILVYAAYGDEDFYTLKAVFEELFAYLRIEAEFLPAEISYMHPTRTAKIFAGGKEIGYLGEVADKVVKAYGTDKRVYLAEVDCDYLTEHASRYTGFKPVSKYPPVERDLALITDESVAATDILKAVRLAADSALLTDARIFDVFVGPQLKIAGKKSVAVRLTFRSNERTLVDAEVNELIDKILKKLAETLGIKLR